MKKIVKPALLVVTLLLLQSCATHKNFVRKYNSWVGKSMSALIAQIGYPDSTFLLPNKNKVYVYERSRVYSVPSMPTFGYGYGYGGYYGGYGGYGMFGYSDDIVQDTCKLFLETNKAGIIVKWGSRGNSCVSSEEPKKL